MYMLVCSALISRLDSQSKCQMFTLFSGYHVGVPQRYTDIPAPYWALKICAKYFDKYLKFRMQQTDLQFLTDVLSSSIFFNIIIS